LHPGFRGGDETQWLAALLWPPLRSSPASRRKHEIVVTASERVGRGAEVETSPVLGPAPYISIIARLICHLHRHPETGTRTRGAQRELERTFTTLTQRNPHKGVPGVGRPALGSKLMRRAKHRRYGDNR
jgi:hypothetical protein